MSEAALHRAVWQYLQLALPDDAVAFHPANGEARNPVTAARLKGMGVVPGVPDLVLIWKGRAIGIELKTARGRVSPSQKAMAERWTLAGGLYHVCRSVEDVEEFLACCGVPLHASGIYCPHANSRASYDAAVRALREIAVRKGEAEPHDDTERRWAAEGPVPVEELETAR